MILKAIKQENDRKEKMIGKGLDIRFNRKTERQTDEILLRNESVFVKLRKKEKTSKKRTREKDLEGKAERDKRYCAMKERER